jgi:cellobiose phosphorylase
MSLVSDFWRYSDDGKEFSFTRRDGKAPWRNYLSTDRIKSVFSPTGGGMSFGRCSYNDSFLADNNPRLVHVRDQESGASWTINGSDTAQQPADWQCTHGFGYTRLQSKTNEIAGSITYFIPVDEATEVWRIRLENTSNRERRLRVFPFVLWSFGLRGYDQSFDHIFFDQQMIIGECHHWPFLDFRSTNAEYNRCWDKVGFLASSPAPTGYDCVYKSFVGEGQSVTRPAAVQEGACRGSHKRGAASCGALQMDVTVPPGGTADLVVLVGMATNAQDAARIRSQYGTPALADAALASVQQWWTEYMARIRIELPDADITTFANGWNRYGMYTRYYYRFGVRDTAQDMGAFATFDVARAQSRIQRLYETQYQDGSTNHDINQLNSPFHKSINSDVPLWLPWAAGSFIRETGDYTMLEQKYRYFDGGEGTVYEHCVKALDYIRRESGRFGLPLLKCGDWNDCLMGSNKTGVSVWLAIFYHINLMEMQELATRTGRTADAARFLAQARALAEAINTHAWDGRWYLMAFDDEGGVIGGHTEEEGRIYLNPQTWAILAGIAPPERARQSMAAVEELMDTPFGIPLLAPPYTHDQERIGVISRMAAHEHHNGGIWNHAVTWAILAECRIGRPDRALELYRRLMPAYLSQQWPDYTAEPYSYTSFTNPAGSGEPGRCGTGWNTGTVCWIYRVLLEGFAGLTAEFDGLKVNPCLPTGWRTISVKRPYRGGVYQITIEDPKGVSRGVAEMTVNGTKIAGDRLPILPAGEVAQVRVVLG